MFNKIRIDDVIMAVYDTNKYGRNDVSTSLGMFEELIKLNSALSFFKTINSIGLNILLKHHLW